MGTFIAGPPAAGSDTLALSTSMPLCVSRVPLRLIRPSGPRTTPGTKGSKLSKRSSTLGASRTVDSPIRLVADASFGLPESVLVTVTDCCTASNFISSVTLEISPAATATFPAADIPGPCALIV